MSVFEASEVINGQGSLGRVTEGFWGVLDLGVSGCGDEAAWIGSDGAPGGRPRG